MTDVLAITRPRVVARAPIRPRGRASLRAHAWSHPDGAGLSAPRAHLAERAYAAELAHAEWARAHWRATPAGTPLQAPAGMPLQAPAGMPLHPEARA